jgi:hypothetical protein
MNRPHPGATRTTQGGTVNPPTEQPSDVKVVNRLDGTPDRVVLRGEALRRWLEQNRPEGAER